MDVDVSGIQSVLKGSYNIKNKSNLVFQSKQTQHLLGGESFQNCLTPRKALVMKEAVELCLQQKALLVGPALVAV